MELSYKFLNQKHKTKPTTFHWKSYKIIFVLKSFFDQKPRDLSNHNTKTNAVNSCSRKSSASRNASLRISNSLIFPLYLLEDERKSLPL